ncbi:MAG: lysophospholipid acyltransferase family protein [Nocardioides sp.]|uniref:lysophospholipid acyltransferase family protein n=1 Tax=Nocardioides sp. TaxID=35761 RepID=UPI0039E421AD
MSSSLSAAARAALPRTDDVRHPTAWPLYRLAPGARWVIRRWYDVRLHATENIPTTGPVIMASNHVGIADGPLLAIFSPRGVHALTKSEMFEQPFLRRFLNFAGQIPLHRSFTDPGAVRIALRVLRAGHVMAIYPEGARGSGELERFHLGAAYFGLVSGAPIVPAYMFGTRLPGGTASSLPPRRSRIDIVYGAPFHLDPAPWPRRREQLTAASKLLQEHMLVQLDRAKALTGRSLPGPLPSLEENDD